MMLRHLPAMQEYTKRQHPGEHFDYSACLNRIVLATRSSNPGDNHQQADLLGREGTFIQATVQISNHGFQAAFKPGNASIPEVEYLIEPDNPLAQAGIQAGDHIIAIDGTALTKWAQGIALIRNLIGTTPCDEHRNVKITVYRPLLQSAQSPALEAEDDEGYDWEAGEQAA
jgi:C-terminal processing protease CtpA/Prc